MNLIVAVSENWGIGNKNKLLFHIPTDMKFFKKTTTGKTVVMGRKTLESFPGGKPLPNRTNIVLTKNTEYKCADAVVCHSEEELLKLDCDRGNVFVIGGESVYRQLLKYCRVCYVTKVSEKAETDAFMVNLDESADWQLAECSEKIEDNGHVLQFCRYERIETK